MTDIDIFKPDGTFLLNAMVTESSEHEIELMKSDKIKLSWSDDEGDMIPLGSYVMYFDVKYILLEPYFPERRSMVEYLYEPEFNSFIMSLSKVPFLLYTIANGNVTNVESDWNFTGDGELLKSVIQNAIFQDTGNKITVEIDESLTKALVLSFSNVDIITALNSIAEQWDCEWWYSGNTISFKPFFINGIALTLTAGESVSKPSSQSKSAFYNRYYVYGSDRNIPQDYSGAAANTIVKKRLTLDPVKHPKGYIDLPKFDNSGNVLIDDNGNYINDDSVNSGYTFTKVITIDEVYPKANVKVRSIKKRLKYMRDSNDKLITIGSDSNGKPIYDSYYLYYLTLEDVTTNQQFKINKKTYSPESCPEGSLIKGLTLSAHFKSGALTGREFELSYYETATSLKGEDGQSISIDSGTFEIIMLQDNTIVIPNAGIEPILNDEVIVFNIKMPQSYIQNGYDELEQKALLAIYEDSRDKNTYSVDSNPIWFEENVPDLKIGRHITLISGNRTIDTRVIKLVTKLDYSFEQEITLSKEITKGRINTLFEKLEATNQSIINVSIKDDTQIQEAKRRAYEASRELQEKVFDTEGNYFSEKIAPLSIETSMLAVGARSQQLTLQNVIFQPNYNANPNTIVISSGTLIHYTINPTITKWNMAGVTMSSLADTALYVYARCHKTNTASTGTWIADSTERTFDSDPTYYYFLVGTLSSTDSTTNTRTLALTYGFTTVNGRYVRTGRIESNDGNTYFDLDNGEIGGKIVFKSTSGANKTLATAINEVETTATNANNAATTASENAATAITTAQVVDAKANTAVNTANTAQTDAATAKQLAENIQVGSRNYIRNISSRSVWTVSEDGIWYQGDIDSDGWFYPQCQHQGISLTKGDYIITVWLLDTTATSSNGIGVMTPARTSDSVPAIIGSFGLGSKFCTAGRYTFKFTLSEDSIVGVKVKNRGRYKIKLEQGNVSTDWTIAPEDVAATVINNLQVGGRNIVLNSSRPVKLRFGDNTPTPWTMAAGFANTTFAADSTLSAWVSYYVDDWNESYPPVSDINLGGKKGESHTWGWAGWTEDEKMIQLTPTTRRYYFKVPTANRILVRVWLYSEYTDAAHTPAVLPTIYNVMASFGHVLTDWEPAPEDVDYLKTAINQGTTEIDGGLVLSNIMAVKDINGNITAGMNGLSNGGQAIGNDCRIWAGATADGINGAPFRVYDNGHVELQDVNINSVDSQGNTAAIENGSFLIKASNKSVKTRISQENISGFDASSGSITATINSFESDSIAFISNNGAKEYTGSEEVTIFSYTATKTCYIDIPDIRLYAAVKTAENAAYPSLWVLANIDVRVSISYLSISRSCSAQQLPPLFGNSSNNITIPAKRCNLAAGESVIIKASYSFMMSTNYPDAIKEQPQRYSVSMSVTPAGSVVNGQYGAYANNLSSNGFVFSSESGKMMGYINNAAQDAEYFRMQQQDFTLRGTAQTLQFRRTPTAPFVDAFPLAAMMKLTYSSGTYNVTMLYNPFNVLMTATQKSKGTVVIIHELGTANLIATGCGNNNYAYISTMAVSATTITIAINDDSSPIDYSCVVMLWKY